MNFSMYKIQSNTFKGGKITLIKGELLMTTWERNLDITIDPWFCRRANSFYKGSASKYSSFTSSQSIRTTQPCHCSTKAAIVYRNEWCGCVQIKPIYEH